MLLSLLFPELEPERRSASARGSGGGPSTHRACGLVLLLCGLGGCFRTRYINLAPHPALEAATASAIPPTPPTPKPHSGWQHFFVWGWVPGERVIPAAEICGGPEWVKEIRTERRFEQGLSAAFAGYYLHVYSPYDGRVVCSGDLDRH